MLWLKFIHIAGLTIWVAGLLYLPAMLIAHNRVRDHQDFARVRMASRLVYMGLVSPSAFVAVGAGTALLFFGDALHPWMFLKLMAVAVLVLAHLRYGYVLAHLSDPEAKPPNGRLRFIEGGVAASAAVILALVLAKPDVSTDALPVWLTEPGVLERPESAQPVPHRLRLRLLPS